MNEQYMLLYETNVIKTVCCMNEKSMLLCEMNAIKTNVLHEITVHVVL